LADLNKTISTDIAVRFEKLARVVHELADPLTESQLWTKPFSFGNSVGHLLLHLTGNLSYYIGAQIAGTGYVRDRPREFTESAPPSKQEVLMKFDETVNLVVRTIRSQSAEDWSASYTAVNSDARDRFEMVLQCVTHLHHHIGQLVYLSFELNRKDRSNQK
jgi:hypothetical protein